MTLPHVNDLIRQHGTLDDDGATDEVILDLMELDGRTRDDAVPDSLLVVRPAIKRQLLDVRREESRTRERLVREHAARPSASSHRRWRSGVQVLALDQLRELLGGRVKVDERDELLADTMSPAEWGNAAEYKYEQAESVRDTGNLYRSVQSTLLALNASSIVDALVRGKAA